MNSDLDTGWKRDLTDKPEHLALSKTPKEYKNEELERLVWNKWDHCRQMSATNRIERQYDSEIYQGKQLKDDELARIAPKYADLRTSLLRKPVDHMISFLTNRRVEGRVRGTTGGFAKGERAEIIAEYDKRLKAAQQGCNMRDVMHRVARDCVVTGEGIVYDGLDEIPSRTIRGMPNNLTFFLKHVNWRSIWIDPKSVMPDLSDADHLFHLRLFSLDEALRRWPGIKRNLVDISHDGTMRNHPDNMRMGWAGYGGPEGTSSSWSLSYNGLNDMSFSGQRQIIHGVAWVRQWTPEVRSAVLWRMEFLMPENMNRLWIIKKPTNPYAHNRIPYSRMWFELDGETNQPYSPMVRCMRAYDKAATSILRTLVRQAASRGVTINTSMLENDPSVMGKSQEAIIAEIREELAKPAFVLRSYGPKDTIEFHNLQHDMDKGAKMLELLRSIIQDQSGIAPELLGESTPQMAGITMEMKREEAAKAYPSLSINQDACVRGTVERMLSNMEEYAGAIAYPEVEDNEGKVVELTSDGDATIEGNLVEWHVVPQEGSEIISREQANVAMTFLQHLTPTAMLRMAPGIIRMLGIADGEKMFRAFKQVIEMEGLQVPAEFLNEVEKAQAEERARMEQEDARRIRTIGEEQIKADIEKTKSEADLNVQKAITEAVSAAIEFLNAGGGSGEEGSNDKENKLKADYEEKVGNLSKEIANLLGKRTVEPPFADNKVNFDQPPQPQQRPQANPNAKNQG